MSALMSDTIDSATYQHLKNMIKQLCYRDAISDPDLTYEYKMLEWLKNYPARDINWADQQVKEYHRVNNIPYRALKGRGRPVGAKNKKKAWTHTGPNATNKAGVSSDYFSRLLNASEATEVNASLELSPIEEQKLTVIPSNDEEAPDNEHPDIRINNIDYRLAKLEFTVSDISKSITRNTEITSENINELRNRLNEEYNNFDERLEKLITKVNNIVDNRPNIIVLKQPDPLPDINAGVQHRNFEKLLKACNARKGNGHHHNIWLHGPAGTGKTTAAEKIAEVMGMEFRYNGALATKFELVGYPDANGNYVRTVFRDTWEHGGVYLFDEIDGSMPDALLAMNGALANSIASFPDGMIPRHKDCVIIAGANTTGLGGGIEYVGAMQQNKAFLNRFEYIDWPHDDALEDALCPNKEWLARVRQVRQNVYNKQIKSHLITMRASINGASLLNAGLDWEDVEQMTLKCGMTDAQWNMVR